MRGTKAKQLKKALGITGEPNPILRRTYRRAKKFYTRLPEAQKQAFIQNLKILNKQ